MFSTLLPSKRVQITEFACYSVLYLMGNEKKNVTYSGFKVDRQLTIDEPQL